MVAGGQAGGQSADGALWPLCRAALCDRHAASGMSAGDAVAAAPAWVFVARAAITAATTRNALQARSAAWTPPVRADGVLACAAIRWFVRPVAIAVRIARPRAAPTVDDVVISAAASPALWAGTPALAAFCTPTMTAPSPSAMITRPGSRSVR